MPELAWLILTSFDDEDALLDSITAGCVLKQISGTELTLPHPIGAGPHQRVRLRPW